MQYGLCKINKSVPPLTRFFFTHIVISWCITICAVVEQIWHYFDFDLLWKRITQRCFVTEEKPRVDASSKARNIPCDTSLECCSNVRENYCRMWWLGSWTMCAAWWRRETRDDVTRTRTRERMREIAYGEEGEGEGEGRGLLRHWESMSLKGQRLTHLLIYSWRYTRELLPFPLSSTLFLAGPMSILNYYISA